MKNRILLAAMVLSSSTIFADDLDLIVPSIPSSTEINELVVAPKTGCEQCGVLQVAGPEAPVGTLLNSMPISSMPIGTIFQITKDIEIKNPSNKKMDNTIILLNGNVIGSSQHPSFLTSASTRDELKSKLGSLLGKDSPNSGMYCFIQTHKNGALALSKGKYQILDCRQQEAVSKVEGGATTNFSFNLFGKTNQSVISSCWMGTIGDNPGQGANLGCVAYRSDKVATTDDFIKAIGGDSKSVRFADPRSPEKIKADQAVENAKMEKIAQEKLAKAEKDQITAKKKEAALDDLLKRKEATDIWFNDYLKRMPKYNDPAYLKLAGEQPEVKKLHDECQQETLMRALQHPTMPKACVDFFVLIKK